MERNSKVIKFIPKQIRIERVSKDAIRLVGMEDGVDLFQEEFELPVGTSLTFDTTWRFTISKS